MYLGLTHGKIKTNIFKKETLPYVYLCMYLCLHHRRSKICHFELYMYLTLNYLCQITQIAPLIKEVEVFGF